MITLSQTHLRELSEHARQAYPDECCGALFGRRISHVKQCTLLRPMDNQSTENRRRRFAITTEDYKKLEAYGADNQLELLGFYHSHPDHPAQPSATDLQYAWPFFSYIIMNVEKGVPGPVNSFELDMETNQFRDESVSWLTTEG